MLLLRELLTRDGIYLSQLFLPESPLDTFPAGSGLLLFLD